ncbi:MAG TPA: cation-translocating P-type ATPase [Thermoanaerobaculia bacterium]|nr:cation-translocating P-type ATPase [Thermoanaerobaculia bacterium]
MPSEARAAAGLNEILAEDGWRIVVAGLAIPVIVAIGKPRAVFLLGIVAAIVAGFPILREGVESLVRRRMTMELSMSIAIIAALAIREATTALIILLFVLVAEVLEELNLARGRQALSMLTSLLPRTVEVQRREHMTELDIESVAVGDVVLVRPGGRIPTDGEVVSGTSTVDESTITGESLPLDKAAGAHVYAGTLNYTGSLLVRSEAIGRDTAFGKIVAALEVSDAQRAPIERLSDQLAGWIVVVALLAAATTFGLTRDPRAAISVVIVAGACGVAAGTPLAILGAIGQAARRQIVIKGGIFVEALSTVDTVVFDKTGTLTLGAPAVTAVQLWSDVGESELLRAGATAEQHSEHPIARAIVAAASGLRLEAVAHFYAVPGRGVVCTTTGGRTIHAGTPAMFHDFDIPCTPAESTIQSGTEVLIAVDGACIGSLLIEDVPRAESREAIARLRRLGLRTIVLTGDRAAVARSISERIDADETDSDLLPAQKQFRIVELRRSGRRVAMVGDGINDAPALREAHVGIAMGSGTDITREAADILLLGDDLRRIADAVSIARRCRRVILQNAVGTIVVDLLGIALAAAGVLHPVAASAVHVSSELLFILNAARMLPARKSEPQQPLSQ